MHINNLKYVIIDYPQINAGKKHMLYIEMEILTALKKYESYKKLRKEELAVKNLLKKTISQLNEKIKVFDNLLPQLPKEQIPKFQANNAKPLQITKTMQKRDVLEEQIEDLRRKISALNR